MNLDMLLRSIRISALQFVRLHLNHVFTANILHVFDSRLLVIFFIFRLYVFQYSLEIFTNMCANWALAAIPM